jgi:hypothetical protein
MQELTHPLTPVMTVIHTRPTKVLPALNGMGMGDVYVQCRLADGEDVHVPLRAIFELFAKEVRRRATGASAPPSAITETGSD